MMTPEQLMRPVEELRATLDGITWPGDAQLSDAGTSCTTPAAVNAASDHESEITTMAIITGRIPPGWVRTPTWANGVPLWRWRDEQVYAATRDMDQLLFLGAALARFDQMTAQEFHAFVTSPPEPADP